MQSEYKYICCPMEYPSKLHLVSSEKNVNNHHKNSLGLAIERPNLLTWYPSTLICKYS